MIWGVPGGPIPCCTARVWPCRLRPLDLLDQTRANVRDQRPHLLQAGDRTEESLPKITKTTSKAPSPGFPPSSLAPITEPSLGPPADDAMSRREAYDVDSHDESYKPEQLLAFVGSRLLLTEGSLRQNPPSGHSRAKARMEKRTSERLSKRRRRVRIHSLRSL